MCSGHSDIRICFVGDSLVNGTDDPACLGWAGRLCVDMYERGIPVTYYNLGVRRNTSRDILQRWQAECTARLPVSCDAWVVFSFGVNDTNEENGVLRVSQEESFANVRAILQDAAAAGYRTLMVGPPPIDNDAHNARIKVFSAYCAQTAAGLGVPYVDLYGALVGDAMYRAEVAGNDGAHPASAGYEKLVGIIIERAQSWLFEANG